MIRSLPSQSCLRSDSVGDVIALTRAIFHSVKYPVFCQPCPVVWLSVDKLSVEAVTT